MATNMISGVLVAVVVGYVVFSQGPAVAWGNEFAADAQAFGSAAGAGDAGQTSGHRTAHGRSSPGEESAEAASAPVSWWGWALGGGKGPQVEPPPDAQERAKQP